MTEGDGSTFKKYVRTQMADGEKYTQARRRILLGALINPETAPRAAVTYLQRHPEVVAEMARSMPRA